MFSRTESCLQVYFPSTSAVLDRMRPVIHNCCVQRGHAENTVGPL